MSKTIYKLRYVMVTTWILLFLFFGYYALKLPGVLGGDGFETEGDFKKVNTILQDEFGREATQAIVLFEKKEHATKSEFKKEVEESTDRLKNMKEADAYISPFEQKGMFKEDIAYGVLLFKKEEDRLKEEIKQIDKKIKSTDKVKITLTGNPVFVTEVNEASQNDLKMAEMIGIPIAIVVLILSFGSLVASIIPIVTGMVSTVISMGILYFFGQITSLSVFMLNVVPMIGIALGIDFALLFVNRFKEEIREKSLEESISKSIKTAGHSIFFSGICVFIGLSAMMMIDVALFKAIAIGGMTVVLVSIISALTFLPSILSILGGKINKGKIIKIKSDEENKWRKFARIVMKRPVIMSSIALIGLLISTIPIKDMHLNIPGKESLPKENEIRLAIETFEEHFTDKEKTQVPVIVEAKNDILEKGTLETLELDIEKLEKDERVYKVESILSYTNTKSGEILSTYLQDPNSKKQIEPIIKKFVSKNMTLLTVTLEGEKDSKEVESWLKDVEREMKNGKFNSSLIIGGEPKFKQEIFDEIYEKAPIGLSFVLISTFIILMIAFRSIVIPLKAVLMNVLSLTATFGILVYVFQNGLFGMEANDIGLVLPVIVFSLVFGLSMDYEVFLISRIQEVYKETKDNDLATIEGLASTSKIITSAAAIMIAVTGAFAFTDVTPVKQIGIGIALAIFIDATIVRMILVPSLMKLLGKANWWFPIKNKKRKK